ncbi:MAG: D-alanyl-D-alanine carboxypeptidase family protein [bacterium]|nr:D-alanyl-D-alanine carboxypeptidase family protein [bacterium]
MTNLQIQSINLSQIQSIECPDEQKNQICSIFQQIDSEESDNKPDVLTSEFSITKFLSYCKQLLKENYDNFMQEINNFSNELQDDEIQLVVNGSYDKDQISYKGITHFRYNDCPKDKLISIGNCRVHKDLADAFKEMQTAAKKDGIDLNIVSGFRSIADQRDRVFIKKFKDPKNPTPEEFKERLKWSAPSEYSEHHTGLAIDINSTETSFENTKAFDWLKNNAHKFGFEQSFIKDNKQGLGNEPWHWRFVGKNNEYADIFKEARNFNSNE